MGDQAPCESRDLVDGCHRAEHVVCRKSLQGRIVVVAFGHAGHRLVLAGSQDGPLLAEPFSPFLIQLSYCIHSRVPIFVLSGGLNPYAGRELSSNTMSEFAQAGPCRKAGVVLDIKIAFIDMVLPIPEPCFEFYSVSDVGDRIGMAAGRSEMAEYRGR